MWHIIDSLGAFILLSRHIRVSSRRINSLARLVGFLIHLGDGCVFFLTGQVWIVFDGLLLSICGLFYRCFGSILSRWCLWHIVNGLGALGLLSGYVRIAGRIIDGLTRLGCFFINLADSSFLLFLGQSRIIVDHGLLVIRCLIHCCNGIELGGWDGWHIANVLKSLVLGPVYVGLGS